MSSSRLPLMELRGPAAAAPDRSLIVVIIPVPKLAPGLCSKALDFIKSLPRSSSEHPEKLQLMICQNRRHTPRLPMELSAPINLTDDGVKQISLALSNHSQQPSRNFFLPRKTAKIAKAFAHANDLHLNGQLKRLAIFCDGSIQYSPSELVLVKAQLQRMFQDKVPVSFWHGQVIGDLDSVMTIKALSQNGACVIPHATTASCKVANPFKISMDIPSSFRLRDNLELTVTFSQCNLATYNKAEHYSLEISGGKYFVPTYCSVPRLQAPYDSATVKVTLQYNRDNASLVNDASLLALVPERLHIAVKCENSSYQYYVDCETAGFQMSLNPLISNFRGLTPLIFGFSGAGKSSFVNSVNFIATSSTSVIAATGNYDGQVTLCLNTIPIGTNGDITVIDSVGMTTGENEVSFLGDEFKLILQNQMPLNVFWRDMIGAEFGAAMLNQSAVLQYQHMNPEKTFSFPENRVNCVLGVVSLGLLESTAVKKKMTKVAHKLTSEFGVMTVWAVTHVESATDNARFKSIAESIDFATLIPVANYTHFDSHNFSKETGIIRVLLALENSKFAPKLPTPVMIPNAMQYTGNSTGSNSAFESDSMSYISHQESSYTPRQQMDHVAVPDIGKGSMFDQFARRAAPAYNVFHDGASSSSGSTVETYVPASPASSSHWAPPPPQSPQGSPPQHGGAPPVNGTGSPNAANADAEYMSRLERKIRTFDDSGSDRPPGYR